MRNNILNMPSYNNAGIKAEGLSESGNMKAIREFTKQQIRLKGFICLSSALGALTNLSLDGTARILKGISVNIIGINPFVTVLYDTRISLKLNSETILEQVNSFTLFNFYQTDHYQEIPRPLNGTDNIQITVIDATSRNYHVTLYFI